MEIKGKSDYSQTINKKYTHFWIEIYNSKTHTFFDEIVP